MANSAVEVAYVNDWPGDPAEVEVVFTDESRAEMYRYQYDAILRNRPT